VGGATAAERIDNGQLLRHYLNGDLPQLNILLAACREHFLPHRQLRDPKAFPLLHCLPQVPVAWR